MKRRNKGEGSISKLPNGHYKATITIGKGIDGKQKRRSITCSTKTELIDKLAELKVHYNLLSPKEALRVNSTITLASYAADWLEERQQVISYNSNKHYEKMVKVFSIFYIFNIL